jgi:hypothetical protein
MFARLKGHFFCFPLLISPAAIPLLSAPPSISAPTFRFSTQTLPQRERVAAWYDVLGAAPSGSTSSR